MGRGSLGFKRVNDAFDELARLRPCESSSGSEHSAEDLSELSDLIDSFVEREGMAADNGGNKREEKIGGDHEGERGGSDDDESDQSERDDSKEMLRSLFVDDGVKRKIRAEAEIGLSGFETRSRSSQGFKRRLMSRLRERGLDSGLCKSRWSKTGRFPSGEYEYIDVITHNSNSNPNSRYIIEVDLAGEFTIARPTEEYESLLNVFPEIFVGTAKELKQVVRLMSNAARVSIKSREMHLPPWRKSRYLQAKWLSSYKRTTNAAAAAQGSSLVPAKRWAGGFEMAMVRVQVCRGEVGGGVRVGNLAQVLKEV